MELSTEQLLHAQTHVWNHMYSVIRSKCLKCAVELGIPDVIKKHGKPIKLSDLVVALRIDPRKSHCMYRFMRILIQSEFFVKVPIEGGEEGYWLEPSANLLLADDPVNMRSYILGVMDQVMKDPLGHLSEWFQDHGNNCSPFAYVSGGSPFWESLGREPRVNKLFHDAMVSDSKLAILVLLENCRDMFQGLDTIVDVGGGNGVVAKGIAAAFPEINCTVLDLPHVVQGLEGTPNLSFVGGDMFSSIPRADALLLKWVLHNWNDEECVKILKKCKEALEGNGCGKGKLIIIEIVVGDEEREDTADQTRNETQFFFDATMMKLCSGKERTEKEFATLFLKAGFARYNISPVLGLRSVIQVFA